MTLQSCNLVARIPTIFKKKPKPFIAWHANPNPTQTLKKSRPQIPRRNLSPPTHLYSPNQPNIMSDYGGDDGGDDGG